MQSIKSKGITWVDIKNPAQKDMKWLKERFNLHPLVAEDLLPPLDYPKVENFGDYFFIVVFYPYFDKEKHQTVPLEVDMIVSKKYIITSHYRDIVPLKKIFDQCNLYEEKREKYFENTGELVYQIIRELFSACLPKLSHIKKNIDEVEEKIFSGKQKEMVERISFVKRDIIGFERTIGAQKIIINQLNKESANFFPKKMAPYFRDLIHFYEKLESILAQNHKTLKALDSTNQSLLTSRTNETIKILTIFSVIVLPLTLIASIFGMNTAYLPFVGTGKDFWYILIIMGSSLVLMLLLFKAKKWM